MGLEGGVFFELGWLDGCWEVAPCVGVLLFWLCRRVGICEVQEKILNSIEVLIADT